MVMPSLDRLLRSGVAVLCGLLMAMPLVHAVTSGERQLSEGGRQSGKSLQQKPRHQSEGQRPYAKGNAPEGETPTQRLSPEERRQLRRDIKDAGRQIYPPK